MARRCQMYVDTVVLAERAEELKTLHLHEQEIQPDPAASEPPLAKADGPDAESPDIDFDDDFDIDL
ncbi:hypothetical protein [Streptomyces sp. NPDC059455]|uniref:hypothetical protein n=1 Tax=Streptomyces sp. NPDC059455 TaxID=3346837 RepID=UPI00367CCC79